MNCLSLAKVQLENYVYNNNFYICEAIRKCYVLSAQKFKYASFQDS